MGINTFARANSVAIGRDAASVAAASRTVSIGHEAKSHTDSVALGASTETSQSSQVAVGPRHLEAHSIAAAPVAPAAGRYRMYGQLDGATGKMKIMAQFPTGAPVLVAEEA